VTRSRANLGKFSDLHDRRPLDLGRYLIHLELLNLTYTACTCLLSIIHHKNRN
jgi:hypothetical protein